MTKLNKHLAQMILASDKTCCTQADNDFLSHCQTLDSLQNDHSAVFTTTYVCQCAPMYAHCQAWPNTSYHAFPYPNALLQKPCQWRVYVCVTKGGLKACFCLHVSVCTCVCICMHVYLLSHARIYNNGGMFKPSYMHTCINTSTIGTYTECNTYYRS